MEIPPDLVDEIIGLLAEAKTIDAIKRVRGATGWNLPRAKTWVEKLYHGPPVPPPRPSPLLNQLSPEDKQVAFTCLAYVLNQRGDFLARLGLNRRTLEKVLSGWPNFEGDDNRALDTFFEGLFRMGVPGVNWPQAFGVPRAEARQVLRRCRYARSREQAARTPPLRAPTLAPQLEAELVEVIKGEYRPLDVIKRIHDETGASMLECKQWLQEHQLREAPAR